MSDQGSNRLGVVSRIGNWPFLMVIYVYRATLSPFIGGQCRFEPTCSRYGIEAYRRYGPLRGTLMTCGRILRCNPFSKGGYDPVPIPSCGHEHGSERAGDAESDREHGFQESERVE